MNEEAIQHAYDLFTNDGYTKSVDEFKTLMSSNPDALAHSYGLFQSDGYSKSIEEFQALMAGNQVKEEVKKKDSSTDTTLPTEGGESVSGESNALDQSLQGRLADGHLDTSLFTEGSDEEAMSANVEQGKSIAYQNFGIDYNQRQALLEQKKEIELKKEQANQELVDAKMNRLGIKQKEGSDQYYIPTDKGLFSGNFLQKYDQLFTGPDYEDENEFVLGSKEEAERYATKNYTNSSETPDQEIKEIERRTDTLITGSEARIYKELEEQEQAHINAEEQYNTTTVNSFIDQGYSGDRLTQLMDNAEINQEYVKSKLVLINGEETSVTNIENQLYDSDFIDGLQDGSIKVTIHPSIKDTDYGKFLENAISVQSNAGGEFGDIIEAAIAGGFGFFAGSAEFLEVAEGIDKNLESDEKGGVIAREIKAVADQYTSMQRMYRHPGFMEAIRAGDVSDAGYLLGRGIAGSSVQIGVTALLTYLKAPRQVTLPIIGASAYGQKSLSLKEQRREGNLEMNNSTLILNSLLSGGAEMIWEIPTLQIIEGVQHITKGASKATVKAVTKKATEGLFKDLMKEGLSEAGTSVTEMIVDHVTGAGSPESFDQIVNEVGNAFVTGVGMAGGMRGLGGTAAITSSVINKLRGVDLTNKIVATVTKVNKDGSDTKQELTLAEYRIWRRDPKNLKDELDGSVAVERFNKDIEGDLQDLVDSVAEDTIEANKGADSAGSEASSLISEVESELKGEGSTPSAEKVSKITQLLNKMKSFVKDGAARGKDVQLLKAKLTKVLGDAGFALNDNVLNQNTDNANVESTEDITEIQDEAQAKAIEKSLEEGGDLSVVLSQDGVGVSKGGESVSKNNIKLGKFKSKAAAKKALDAFNKKNSKGEKKAKRHVEVQKKNNKEFKKADKGKMDDVTENDLEGEFNIMSAELDGLDAETNDKRTNQLEKILASKGFKFKKVTTIENGVSKTAFMVEGIESNQALSIASGFGQKSITSSKDGVLHSDGTVESLDGDRWRGANARDGARVVVVKINGKKVAIRLGTNAATHSKLINSTNAADINSFIEYLPENQKKILGHVLRFFSNINGLSIRVVKNTSAMKKQLEAEGYSPEQINETSKNNAFYRDADGVMVLNLEKMNLNTPFHEIVHPLVDFIKVANPELYAKIEVMVEKAEPGMIGSPYRKRWEDKQGRRQSGSYLDWVKAQPVYKNKSRSLQIEEAFAEMMGDAAANQFMKDNSKLKQITDMIREILSVFNLDLPKGKDITNLNLGDMKNIGDLRSGIGSALAKGASINVGGVDFKVTKAKNPEVVDKSIREQVDSLESGSDLGVTEVPDLSSVNTQSIRPQAGDYTPNFDEGKVKRGSITSFAGKKAMLMCIDRSVSGTVESPSGVVKEFNGGVYFSYQEDNGVWAFAGKAAASRVLKKAKESDGLIFLVAMSPQSIDGTIEMFDYVMDEIDNAIKKGKVKKAVVLDFINKKLSLNKIQNKLKSSGVSKKKVKSTAEFRELILSLEGAFDVRKDLTSKMIKGKDLSNWGIPTRDEMYSFVNQGEIKDLTGNPIVAAIRIDTEAGYVDSRDNKDMRDHPTYPYQVKGEPLMLFDEVVDASEVWSDLNLADKYLIDPKTGIPFSEGTTSARRNAAIMMGTPIVDIRPQAEDIKEHVKNSVIKTPMFHGTETAFDEFAEDKKDLKFRGDAQSKVAADGRSKVTFFSKGTELASQYANQDPDNPSPGARLVKSYLDIRNPFDITDRSTWGALIESGVLSKSFGIRAMSGNNQFADIVKSNYTSDGLKLLMTKLSKKDSNVVQSIIDGHKGPRLIDGKNVLKLWEQEETRIMLELLKAQGEVEVYEGREFNDKNGEPYTYNPGGAGNNWSLLETYIEDGTYHVPGGKYSASKRASFKGLRSLGYDAVINVESGFTNVGVFNASQIKVSNDNLNPQKPGLRFQAEDNDGFTGGANQYGRFNITPSSDRPTATLNDLTYDNVTSLATKGNWAIVTGTIEASGKYDNEDNVSSNAKLYKELVTEFGAENISITDGVYMKEDQGPSFFVSGITEHRAMQVGKTFSQEGVLTRRGNIFTDGSGINPASETVFVGDEALGKDGNSTTKEGVTFSLDVDWGTKVPLSEGIRPQAGDNMEYTSNALLSLKTIKLEKATPAEWIKKISEGVKGAARDVSTIGLLDMLEAYKKEHKLKSVPKDVVAGLIATNMAEIETKILKGNPSSHNDDDYTIGYDGDTYSITTPEGILLNSGVEVTTDVEDLSSAETMNIIDESLDGITVGARYSEVTLPGGENYREFLIRDKSSEEIFTAPHYDEFGENLIASVRADDRVGPNGEKILFVQEIQSDWVQGTNKGDFKTKDEVKEIEKNMFWGTETREDALKKLESLKPYLPWNQTDLWVGLAIRKVINQASKEGYDQVAFVNGEQSDIVQSHTGSNAGKTHEFYNNIVPKNINNELKRLVKGMKYGVEGIFEIASASDIRNASSTELRLNSSKNAVINLTPELKAATDKVGPLRFQAGNGITEDQMTVLKSTYSDIEKRYPNINVEEGMINLFHYSNEELNVVDPRSAVMNSYSKQEYRTWGRGRVFFYTDPNIREGIVTGQVKNETKLPIDRLYPLTEDPLGLSDIALANIKTKRSGGNKTMSTITLDTPTIDSANLSISKLKDLLRDMGMSDVVDFSEAKESHRYKKNADGTYEKGGVESISFNVSYPEGTEDITSLIKETFDKSNFERINPSLIPINTFEEVAKVAEGLGFQGFIYDHVDGKTVTSWKPVSVVKDRFQAASQEDTDVYVSGLGAIMWDLAKPVIDADYELGGWMSNVSDPSKRYKKEDSEGKMVSTVRATQLMLKPKGMHTNAEIKELIIHSRGALNEQIYIADKNQKKLKKVVKAEEARIKASKAYKDASVEDQGYMLEHLTPEGLNALMSNYVEIQKMPEQSELRLALSVVRNHIDILSKSLFDNGLVSGPMRYKIEGNLGFYLTRSYEKYEDANWRQTDQEIIRRAIVFTTNQLITNQGFSKEDADVRAKQMVDELIKSDNKSGALSFNRNIGVGGPLQRVGSIFKNRNEELPKEIRELLGERMDPLTNYTNTISKLSRTLVSHQMYADMLEFGMGKFISEPSTDDSKFSAIPDIGNKLDGAKWGPLDGKFVDNEMLAVLEAYEDGDAEMGLATKMWMTFVYGTKKAATVYNPATHAVNLMGNSYFSMMNGHTSPLKMWEAIKTSVGEITNLNGEQRQAFYEDLISLGVVNSSASLQEVMQIGEDIKLGMNTGSMMDKIGNGVFGKIAKLPLVAASGLDKVATKAYQAEDDLFKIFGFLSEKAKYMDAGMSEADARNQAAKNVGNLYPNYDRVPAIVRTLGRNPFVGTFVSFTAEALRCSKNAIQLAFEEMGSENGAVKTMGAKRLAASLLTLKFAETISSTAIATLFGAFGDDEEFDEEVYGLRHLDSPWNKDAKIAPIERGFYTPESDGYTPENNGHAFVKYMNVSRMSGGGFVKDLLRITFTDMNTPDYDSTLSRILYKFYGAFLSEDMALGVVMDIVNNKGNKIYNPTENIGWNGLDVAKHLVAKLGPGAMKSLGKIEDSMKEGSKLTTKNEVMAMIGLRTTTMDINESLFFTAREIVADMKARSESLEINLSEVNMDLTNVLNPSHPSFDKKMSQYFNGMVKAVSSARRLGVNLEGTKDNCTTMLKNAGVPNEVLKKVMFAVHNGSESNTLQIGDK